MTANSAAQRQYSAAQRQYSAAQRQYSAAPILVTGAHRTGTTWVGKMLTASGEAAYISEPLNVLHRPGVMGAPVQYWYTRIGPENEALYLPALQDTLNFRYHLWAEIRSIRQRKDALRMVRDVGIFLRGWISRQRPLLKDPFAAFSIPWFAQRLNCQVVVTIRHPAAFASSLKRLQWSFDFNDLLAQPLLRESLRPFQQEMERLATIPPEQSPIIEQASLLWRVIYQTIYQHQHTPGLAIPIIVRHEDLSIDPIQGYKTLYDQLGLHFTPQAQEIILTSSSSENPKELNQKKVHATRLDSQANLHNWKHRLTPEEIQRIRSLTQDIADLYYPDQSWD